MKCGHCGECVIFEYSPKTQHTAVPTQIGGDMSQTIQLGHQWPSPSPTDAPPDSPNNVANYFRQAATSIEVGNFDASGMMFRKALESATKSLAPEQISLSLVKRIDYLASSGFITTDLATWAHEIRLGGNEAAHEDEPFSKDETVQLKDFTENFLRYTFTLPEAVKRRMSPQTES